MTCVLHPVGGAEKIKHKSFFYILRIVIEKNLVGRSFEHTTIYLILFKIYFYRVEATKKNWFTNLPCFYTYYTTYIKMLITIRRKETRID